MDGSIKQSNFMEIKRYGTCILRAAVRDFRVRFVVSQWFSVALEQLALLVHPFSGQDRFP